MIVIVLVIIGHSGYFSMKNTHWFLIVLFIITLIAFWGKRIEDFEMLLRYFFAVYLFSNFPCEQTELIQEDYLIEMGYMSE